VASGSQILEVDDTPRTRGGAPSLLTSTSTAHVSRATQQAAHAIASSYPSQTAASAQPTLPGNVDRTADTLRQFKPIIDGWTRTWNNNNPTQPLPPDIREKVKTFLRLVTRPSTGETEMAPEALQVAQNELEELDKVSTQYAIVQLALFIQDAYVDKIKQLHPLLMSSRAKLGENNLSQLDKQRRIVNHEQDVAAFFRSEIVSKIRHIISSRRPNVLFEAIEGYPTSHADMFFKVGVENADGTLVCSSVAVELKRPYGDDYVPETPKVRNGWPNWVSAAEMPSEEFAKRAIHQILHYMEGNDTRAPPSVRGSIVRNIGILSTFNVTWIVIAAAANHSFETNTSLLAELPVTITNARNEQPRPRLYISQPLHIDSEDLPIALAYTYVIEHIIDCMANSTGGYKEVFLEESLGQNRARGGPKRKHQSTSNTSDTDHGAESTSRPIRRHTV
ncbi:hypothetical protein GGI13_003627, partial [Coemansia sp. RSA 455]